jgi:hypothetical protein
MPSVNFRTLAALATLGLAPHAPAAEPASKPAAEAGSSPIPSYLTDPKACVLLLGGGGVVFDREETNTFLFELNAGVTDKLFEGLTMGEFFVEKLVLETRDGQERRAAASAELSRRRCGKIVQLAHFLEGPGTARRFGIEVTVLGVSVEDAKAAEGGHMYTTKGLFQKKYSYPLTDETLRTLTTADIANQIGPDLVDSGLIPLKPKVEARERPPKASTGGAP